MKERLFNTKKVKGIRRFVSVVMLGIAFSGCGETTLTAPYPQVPGSTGNPSATSATSKNVSTFSINNGDCADLPAFSVVQGDIVIYQNRSQVQNNNGQFVGGRTMYDNDPNTGNITILDTAATACAQWGASGATTDSLSSANTLANTYKTDMTTRRGCESKCSSVAITNYP